MSQLVAIVDYAICNVNSVRRALQEAGANVVVSNKPDVISKADRIVLPGVGHFDKGMNNLESMGLIPVLQEAVMLSRKPVLGICLGMQLMARHSQEAPGVAGLGWLDDTIVRFHVTDSRRYKVPHIGWNTLNPIRDTGLLNGITREDEFYFTHSYHYGKGEAGIVAAQSDYSYAFASAVVQQHICGTQFHPEKSGAAGLQLLKNFLSI